MAPKPVEVNKVVTKKEKDFQEEPVLSNTKLFRVQKVFSEWMVMLEVSSEDTYDSLLKKAMKEINDKRIIGTHPENDHVLVEM